MTLLMASMPPPGGNKAGGNGKDTFVFSRTSGRDTVAGFGSQDILLIELLIENGASRMKDLDFTDTKKGA